MAFFIRFVFLITLLYSFQGYTQPVSCSSCDATVLLKEISALNLSAQKTVVFQCPLKLGNLNTVRKWGISDAKGNVLVKPFWDSIGTVTNGLAEVFQYVPQRKKAPLKAGLISVQQKNILPFVYRSIRVITGTYYSVDTGKGFQVWKAGKGFLSPLPYDSIVKTPAHILLYTEGFCHHLDSTAQKIEQGPYREWHTNDNNKVYPTFYDTLYIYRNGTAIVSLFADSIAASSKADEIILYRNNSKVRFRLVQLAAPSIHEADPIHPVPLSTLSDSTLIKIKKKTVNKYGMYLAKS